jgi:hypothetical protein
MRGDNEPNNDTWYQDHCSDNLWHSKQTEGREGSYGSQVSKRKEGAQHPASNPWLGILEDKRNRRPMNADHGPHNTCGATGNHQRTTSCSESLACNAQKNCQ